MAPGYAYSDVAGEKTATVTSTGVESNEEASAAAGVKILIPQQYPGAFYYPPCKCDLINQIRYFNPKTRQFYYHGVQPPDLPTMPSDGAAGQLPTKNLILAGEPETFSDYAHPYHMVPANPNVLQGPFIQPGPNIPKSPYSVPVVPLHESGLCEVIIVMLVLLLWLYSFYRLYLVWQKTLNFSEASIQGPQGWDLLVNWVYERIQLPDEIKKVKLVGFRKKSCTGKTPTNSAGGGGEEGEEENGENEESERQDDPEDTTTEDPLIAKEKQETSQKEPGTGNEDDLDRIERCSSPQSMDVERGKLKLQLLKDYDSSRTDMSRSSSHGSGSSCPISRTGLHPAKVQQQYPLYSHPCSLQILHEDETSPSVRIPPPPLACFGGIGVKLTATEMRRARMMNKQMSEDCGRQHLALNRTQQHLMHHQNQGGGQPPMMLLEHSESSTATTAQTGSFRWQSNSGDNSTRSLQKLTDSCEMKDLTGRSIYETTQRKGNIQVVRKQYSLQSNSEAI